MTNEEYLLELSSRGELSAWLGAERIVGERCKPMGDLMAECAEYERIVDGLTAQVEELREKLSRALDNAADTLRLMEVG